MGSAAVMGTTEWSWWARGEYEAHPPGSSGSASGRTSYGGSPTSVLQSRQSLLDIETGDTEEGFEAVETAVQPADTGLHTLEPPGDRSQAICVRAMVAVMSEEAI